jgi:hypothetical protein
VGLRKRWRLLRKRLLSDSSRDLSPECEITLSDLRFISPSANSQKRVKSLWRIHGRAVCSKAVVSPFHAPPIRQLYWEGARSRKIAFWERLIRAQAGELSEVRRFAEEVSSKSGRVVLSWHNASLGAAGGWAFKDPLALFEAPGFHEIFMQRLSKEQARIRASLDIPSAMELSEMRSERLFSIRTARAVRQPDRYAFPWAMSPHQRISMEQVSEWTEKARTKWIDGLILMFALTTLGQKMIDSGEIPCMVLPWIDKFFISSLRLGDLEYIERLFRLVSETIGQPLILFWDDTTRRELPSLGLALASMSAKEMPFRGIGVFDTGPTGSKRADAARIISEEYPRKSLFALRPLNDNHCPDSFRRIFKDLDMGFFLNYDSSWKDNLAFIYTRTQVFPLLSVQMEMESVAPWVFDGRERYAFGAWFRRILRRISLGERAGVRGWPGFWYSGWANLL